MRRVFLESPYSGNVEENLAYARECMHDSIGRGEAPYASHLLYTQPGVLDDDKPEERALGIAAGQAFLPVCEASVVYTDLGISEGMKLGMAAARELGIRIEFRSLYGDVCRGCGCTDDNCMECVELTGEPCYWISPGLCSACTDEPPFDLCECDPPPPDTTAADPMTHPEGCPYRELALRNRRVAALRREEEEAA